MKHLLWKRVTFQGGQYRGNGHNSGVVPSFSFLAFVYVFLLLVVCPLKVPLSFLLDRSWTPQRAVLSSDWAGTLLSLSHLNKGWVFSIGQGTSDLLLRGAGASLVCLVIHVSSLKGSGGRLPRELLWSHFWLICLLFLSWRIAGFGHKVLCCSAFPNTELADWLFPEILIPKYLLDH